MRILFFALLLLSLTTYGQAPVGSISSSVSNTKTSRHVQIPGTRLFIIPPPGFSVATTFVGLQKGDNAMVNIFDLVGGNFITNAATFSKQAFEQQGAKVFDYQQIQVNGYPAKYISMQGDPAAKMYALVFGDTTFSTMIMSVYPAGDEGTGKQILAALNTIYYDKGRKIDPFETAFFSLDDKASRLKFSQYNANMFVYTVGGTDNMKGEEPFVLIMQLPKDGTMTTKSISDMFLSKMQKYGLTEPEVKSTSMESINGYDTYETEIRGKLKGTNGVIYQCIVVKDNKAVAIQGVSKEDLEKSVQEFKSLVRTIRIK